MSLILAKDINLRPELMSYKRYLPIVHCIAIENLNAYSRAYTSRPDQLALLYAYSMYHATIGRVLIAWFNDCILGKLGQITNPIIAMVDPVPYYSIRARLCLQIY